MPKLELTEKYKEVPTAAIASRASISGTGVSDHGALTGLSDDDHPQYAAVAQDEAISGAWTFSDDITMASGKTVDGTDISDHVADADAHHDQEHAITGADHTITASQYQIVGATALDTLGLLTPSSAPGDNIIVKTDGNAGVQFTRLGLGASPAADNQLTVVDGGTVGIATGPLLTFDDSNNYLEVTGCSVGIGIAAPSRTLDVYHGSSPQLRLTQTAGVDYVDLEADGSGYLVIDPSGGVVNPGSTMADDLGEVTTMWRALYVAELYAQTLVAQDILATIGGRILVTPTTKLTSALTSVATTIYVEHNQLASGDFVLLETAPLGSQQTEVMKITSAPGGSGPYSYTVSRNQDGSGANEWQAGDAVASLGGAAGEGYIDLTSTSTVLSTDGPVITFNVRTGTTTWNQIAPVVAVGNLNGLCGYSGDEFGIAIGNDLDVSDPTDPAFSGVTVDRVTGMSLYNTDIRLYAGDPPGQVPYVQILADYGILIKDADTEVDPLADHTTFAAYYADSAFLAQLDAGDVIIGKPFNTAANPVGVHWDNSAGTLTIYGDDANYLVMAGTGLAAYANSDKYFDLTSSGLSLYNSSGNPVITFDTSGNATIDNKLKMEGASSAITIGTTPPTSASAGTGIWLDRTGLYGLASSTARFKLGTDGSGWLGGSDIFAWTATGVVALKADALTLPWLLPSLVDTLRMPGPDGGGMRMFIWEATWPVIETFYGVKSLVTTSLTATDYQVSDYGGPCVIFDPGSSDNLKVDDEGWQEVGGATFLVWAWVKADAFSTDRVIVSKYDSGADQRSWELEWRATSGAFGFVANYSGLIGGNVWAISSYTEAVDTWYFVAGYYQPSTLIRIWVGSAADSSLTVDSTTSSVPSSLLNGTAAFAIGSNWDSGSAASFWDGAIGVIGGWMEVPATNINDFVTQIWERTKQFYA